MAFCNKCGASVEDGVAFCSTCGAKIDAEPAVETSSENKEKAAQVMEQVSDALNKGVAKLKELNDTADTTADFEKEDVEKNKLMGVLAYLWILVLIPLFVAKDSKFAKYHTNQGLTLAIAGVVWSIVAGIVTAIHPFLGIIFFLLDIPFIALTVIGIINVINGKAKELPVIGKYTFLK